MGAKLWASLFPLQITKRIYIWMTILILIPTFTLAGLTQYRLVQLEKKERLQQMYAVVDWLDQSMQGSFQDILVNNGALDLSLEEQVKVINEGLQNHVNHVSSIYPGLGMGYYAIDLDRIVAIGPNFQPSLLMQVPRTYPYFKSYETGKEEIGFNSKSLGWQGKSIMNLTRPLWREDRIIGHVWANVTMNDVYAKALGQGKDIYTMGFGALVMTLFFTWYLHARFRREIHSFALIAAAAAEEDATQDSFMPELAPLLQALKKQNQELSQANAGLAQQMEALRKSEQRFVKIFQANPLPMAINDPHDEMRYLDANESILKLTGYAREEFVGARPIDINQWAIPEEREKMLEILNKEGSLRNFEGRFRMKSGEERIWLLSAESMELEGEECFLFSINDITELRRLEKELTRLDRMTLIAQMAAGIAHEIRNPLTTVSGLLQIMERNPQFSEQENYFNLMLSELDRTSSIIKEFLVLSRHKNIALEKCNLTRLVEAVYPLLQASALMKDKQIRLQLGKVPSFLLDEGEIRQLLLNLVNNGLEAMAEGGTLTISTFMKEGQVVLAIHDQGSGISPEVMEKIGTPFYTTKITGTGLGLAVCYSIVARHHARMEIETSPQGTTFSVIFDPDKLT